MKNKLAVHEASEMLARHQRKCIVCHHPDREAIEEEYVHWRDPWELSREYRIEDYRSIHRHARATGLLEKRRENLRSALDNIVEHSEGAKATADSVIRAVRAYSCLTESGEWIDPPARVLFIATRADGPAPIPGMAPDLEALASDRASGRFRSNPRYRD